MVKNLIVIQLDKNVKTQGNIIDVALFFLASFTPSFHNYGNSYKPTKKVVQRPVAGRLRVFYPSGR